MKNIDANKLWSYLERRFLDFGDEYDRYSHIARTADKVIAPLCRMQGATEKRNFIIELKNEILSSGLDA